MKEPFDNMWTKKVLDSDRTVVLELYRRIEETFEW